MDITNFDAILLKWRKLSFGRSQTPHPFSQASLHVSALPGGEGGARRMEFARAYETQFCYSKSEPGTRKERPAIRNGKKKQHGVRRGLRYRGATANPNPVCTRRNWQYPMEKSKMVGIHATPWGYLISDELTRVEIGNKTNPLNICFLSMKIFLLKLLLKKENEMAKASQNAVFLLVPTNCRARYLLRDDPAAVRPFLANVPHF